MTAAIVAGLVKHFSPQRISVSNRGQEKLAQLAAKHGINAAPTNEALVNVADVVVLSVKPQILQAVLAPLAESIKAKRPLIISVAAGIPCASIKKWVGADLPIIRTMPNVPSAIGEGATGLYAGTDVSQEQREIAERIFNSIGLCAWVKQEEEIDLVTALSGSGPAYVMLLLQSMADAAVRKGMSKESAKTLALQTIRGTAGMIAKSDKPLAQLIDEMLLPGGTTEQAVAALRQREFPAAINAAIDAATNRAGQLAQELGD